MKLNIKTETLTIVIVFIIYFIFYIINYFYNRSNTFQKIITIKSKNKDYRYGKYSKHYLYYVVDSYDNNYELNMKNYDKLKIYDSINAGDVIEIKGSYNIFGSLLNIDEIISRFYENDTKSPSGKL
jgi:hypothetical protein